MSSSTDRGRQTWADSARDLGHLLRFRVSAVRRPWIGPVVALLVVGITAAFAWFPGQWQGLRDGDEISQSAAQVVFEAAQGLEGNVGIALAAFLILAIAASMGSGGGRELLSRTEAVIHPVGTRTEHLGALLLTPLNLAWLVQFWGLVAAVALVVPKERQLGAQVLVLLWVLVATAWGQVAGWLIEGVRRTQHGVLLVRTGTGVVVALLGLLYLTDHLFPLARALPTRYVVDAMYGEARPLVMVVLAVLLVLGVWAGDRPAAWALGLPPREELRVASGVHEARHAPDPRWLDADVALLRRLDHGSVWRSVGMRRGLIVLGIGPGAVALVMGLDWSSVMMLPGLAASGAALLFGVNAWCLDGKGMVWRETLPVPAAKVFDARALVLAECLLMVSAITIVLALLRSGLPDPQTGLSVALCWLVVVVQTLATSMRWSVRSPYAVDLSSPRATPAPHAAMAGYAARMSLAVTLTSLLFSAAAATTLVSWLAIPLAAGFLAKSLFRLHRARRRWLSAPDRAQIVLTVAAV